MAVTLVGMVVTVGMVAMAVGMEATGATEVGMVVMAAMAAMVVIEVLYC